MWKCPKCGREFKNQNQEHYCLKPKDIDEYVALQDEPLQPRLQAMRETIHSAIPEAQQRISWGMPTFWDGRNVIQFAASKHHIRLYSRPGGSGAISRSVDRLRNQQGDDPAATSETVALRTDWGHRKMVLGAK